MLKKIYYVFVTIALPAAGVLLALKAETNNDFSSQTCTRYCHGNGGCKHLPVLSDSISSDEGFYGTVIDSLFYLGDIISKLVGVSYYEGYGLANILIFCITVPLVHFVLMILTFKKRGKNA